LGTLTPPIVVVGPGVVVDVVVVAAGAAVVDVVPVMPVVDVVAVVVGVGDDVVDGDADVVVVPAAAAGRAVAARTPAASSTALMVCRAPSLRRGARSRGPFRGLGTRWSGRGGVTTFNVGTGRP
jgi:hypothetical protein